MLRTLEKNLAYYQSQKQQIINNPHSYTSERYHQEYGAWQRTSYTFSYGEILGIHGAAAHYGSPCFYAVHWRKGRSGQHLLDNSETQNVLRNKIAANLGRSIDDISPNLVISARGEDPTYQFGKLAYFSTYTVGYNYRNLHTRQEKYFDQEKYNQALRECEQNIGNTYNAIIGYKEQERLIKLEEDRRQKVLIEAKRKEETKLRLEAEEKRKLNEEINNIQKQIKDIQEQVNYNKNQANIIQSKINTELQKKQDFERKYGQVQENNNRQDDELKNKQEQNFDMVSSVNDKRRAFFLAELWGQTNMKEILDRIKYLGVDANELAHYAILKNHTELFEYALQRHASCVNHMVDGKTLLQHLNHQNKTNLIHKVLEKEKDLSATLITAISQNDISTLTKLHSIDSNLIKQKFAGYSLLQIAISAENSHIEIIQTLLALDNTLVEILNSNGETALKISTRCGNENITELVKQHANLTLEVEQLNLEQSVKNEILNTHDLNKIIRLYQEEHIAQQSSNIESEYEVIGNIEEQYNEAELLGLEDLHL